MKDIAPELLENIQKEFDEKFYSNKKIKALYKKLKDGTANYDDTQSFAKETGKILATVFQNNLSSDVLPDGRMYYNIANRIIPEMLKLDYELVSEVSTGVINKINESAGIGIKARKPKLNEEKVTGIVNIVSGKLIYDQIAYMLKDPVINFSQCIVDDTVRENADFQYKSGLNSKIIRTTTGKCCKWCNSIAGVYPYEDAKKNPDVFKRHKHCNCKVEYLPGDGRRQNVHTKAWSNEVKSDIIQERQYAGLKAEDDPIIKRIREEIIPKQKINKVVERQDIHRKGSKLYEERKRRLKEKGEYGPSFITITDEEILELVREFSATGEIQYNKNNRWNNKESILTNDRIVGVVVNNLTGKEVETLVFKIHYSNDGIHIVPDYPSKKEKKK